MNKSRETVFRRIKNAGFSFSTFVHPTACISPSCHIGEGNIILENVTIQPYVTMGDGNIFWSNTTICHHSEIGNFNFFAASSCVLGRVTIRDRIFFGAHATAKNRITIESDSLIGAAAYVDKDTPPASVIVPSRSVALSKKSCDFTL